jgi:hypothetical protein
MTSIKKPPAVMSDKVRRELSHPERHSTRAISAAIKPPPAAAGLTPATARPVSSLAAVLPSEDDSKEISLGTVASLSAAAVEVCSGPATASAAVPPDALQGVPLSDQKREDRAAGLTPEQAKHAVEACVDTLEWLLGLETLTQEQAELVACFRRMDAALINSRGKKPYLNSLGIPRFPPDCEPKYRHWENGQPLLDTLLELGASDRAIDMRVTMERSPDDWRRWQEIKAQRRK